MSSTDEQIELSFQLELADILAARRLLLWRSAAGKVLLFSVVLLLFDGVAYGSWSSLIPFIVGIVVFVALVLYFLPRRAFRTTPSMRGAQRWTIGRDGLRCESTAADGTRLSSSEFGWELIVRARESKQAFLLSPSQTAACVLPKRALDPATADALRALIAAKVGNAEAA